MDFLRQWPSVIGQPAGFLQLHNFWESNEVFECYSNCENLWKTISPLIITLVQFSSNKTILMEMNSKRLFLSLKMEIVFCCSLPPINHEIACVAWRFWLGAQVTASGRGQRNREAIRAAATWKLFFSRLRRSCARLDKTAVLRRLNVKGSFTPLSWNNVNGQGQKGKTKSVMQVQIKLLFC